MLAENNQSTPQKYLGYAVLVLAIFMAITGILNSAPTFWIIPRVGPFPEELIRSLILLPSIFIVLVRNPISAVLSERFPAITKGAWIVDVVIMLASIWVFWNYQDVLMRIEEGLFDLDIIHPVIAITG